jgi:hypothetical protein
LRGKEVTEKGGLAKKKKQRTEGRVERNRKKKKGKETGGLRGNRGEIF